MTRPRRPHVVILMPDQLRADCLSCAGHPVVRTPGMDAIASQAVRFDRAYTTSPVCMSARTGFLTGLYCHNHGQWGNYGRTPLEAETFARRMVQAGYRSCYVGKSHYYPHRRDEHLDDHKPFMHALGWQEVFETTGPLATRSCDSILTDHWKRLGCLDTFRDDYARRAAEGHGGGLWPSPMPPGEHMDDFVGKLAVRYIEDYRRDEPLLMYVGFGGPHSPWDPPADWAARYDPADSPPPLPVDQPPAWLPPAAAEHHARLAAKTYNLSPADAARLAALYFAKVSHADFWMGQVAEALQRRGMMDNTVLVVWSDHGEMLCDKGRLDKSVFYEASVRVPLMLRIPGGPAGTVSSELVSTVDVMPTLLELAGCDIANAGWGRSLLPVAGGAAGRAAVFSEIDNRTMVFDGRHKMVVDDRGQVLKLFDLRDDPREQVNLAGRADAEPAVAALRETLLLWLLETPNRQPTLAKGPPRGAGA